MRVDVARGCRRLVTRPPSAGPVRSAIRRRCVPARCGGRAATTRCRGVVGADRRRARAGAAARGTSTPSCRLCGRRSCTAGGGGGRCRGTAPGGRTIAAADRLAGSPIDADDAVDRRPSRLRCALISVQHAGRRRRNLRVHLVGGNLEQRLVAIDRVADLLDPSDDRAFRDRLAHLGHDDGCRHRAQDSLWTAARIVVIVRPPHR